MRKSILLLEDDPELGETLEELLEEAGYETDWVTDGATAAERSYEKRYDLYIFDINVPEIDGFELLEALRGAEDATPTLFISALVDLKNIAKGFELGAEDYIKKPFYPEELLIRVNAKLARRDEPLRCGELEFDPSGPTVRVAGEIVSLGEVQLCLLRLFLNNRGRVVDKSDLSECLEHPSDAALRVAIAKLKEKTRLAIKNVRGVGYALESC